MMKPEIKIPNINDSAIPRTALQLLKQMVHPYKDKTILFFVLTFLGILAWTASPLMISYIINEFSNYKTIVAHIPDMGLVHFPPVIVYLLNMFI